MNKKTRVVKLKTLELIQELAAEGELMEYKNGKMSESGDLFGRIYMLAHLLDGRCEHDGLKKKFKKFL